MALTLLFRALPGLSEDSILPTQRFCKIYDIKFFNKTEGPGLFILTVLSPRGKIHGTKDANAGETGPPAGTRAEGAPAGFSRPRAGRGKCRFL